MEMIKRFPMRNILIFGIVAAALRLILALCNPMQMLYQSGSLAGPVLLTLVTIVPLTLFFWVFWLRVTMPRMIWAGSLTAGIGGICSILFRIFQYSAVRRMYIGIPTQGGVQTGAFLMMLADLAVFAGIVLIGLTFMKNPQKKNSLGGLLALIGGCAGGLQMVLALLNSFVVRYAVAAMRLFNTLQTLLGVAAWALVVAFMILLFLGQPAPAPRPKAPGGSSPYDNIPHY